MTGDVLYQSISHTPWVIGLVNLDKKIVGYWPNGRKIQALREKYGRAAAVTILPEDERTVIESRSPDIRVADMLKEFDIPPVEELEAKAEAMHEKFWKRL